MSDPCTAVSENEGLPSSDRTKGAVSLRKSPDSIREFFYRLRSRLRPQYFSTDRTHESSSRSNGSTRPMPQKSPSKKATASQQPDIVDKNYSDPDDKPRHPGQDRKSSLSYSLSHFPSPPSAYHTVTRANGLDDTETLPGVNKRTHSIPRSSVKSSPDERRLYRLETNYSQTNLSDESHPTPTIAISRDAALKYSAIDEEPEETDERERTLRILESKDKSVARRSCSPATIRRHRRSYQLATDPHIEPQQYSDFLRYLEQEITTDITLRLQIWKSLTGDSGNRAASLVDPDHIVKFPVSEDAYYTSRSVQGPGPNSYDKTQKPSNPIHRRPKSCTSIDHSTGWQDKRSKGRSWNRHDQPGSHKPNSIPGDDKESFRVNGHPSTVECNKAQGRRRSAINSGLEHSRCVDPGEKVALQRSNVRKRQTWSQQGMPQKKYPDRKRESTSSFTHVIAQYIKPEMPMTIYKQTQGQHYEAPTPGHKDILT
ncbi:uncharacterized protein GGS22DRAFT_197455 [Annulohypoxylon maeteangense]|uniref:uncharacterized protein n=1 Tax=Annulohypoxylon maeteangense TaxID=1927788 RepID=UPI002008B0EC|nr:uncharacterized protein GGS22DRAFT_197455 [Annulohypoxylon maeteangense]KAI0880522.1 hypothetical protein GGS22DRAFT_197455 [Annulohypoxylon maeteangense]